MGGGGFGGIKYSEIRHGIGVLLGHVTPTAWSSRVRAPTFHRNIKNGNKYVNKSGF